jgi:hypothetical protein
MRVLEHEKLEATAILDDAPIDRLKAREDQRQHHEVGEQDVGRRLRDALALRTLGTLRSLFPW